MSFVFMSLAAPRCCASKICRREIPAGEVRLRVEAIGLNRAEVPRHSQYM